MRKKRKTNFEVPDPNLLGYGTVSNGNSDIPQGNIAYIFRIDH
jgi:hypothetical protein